MNKVFLIDGARTPIGSFLGQFSSLSAPQLGSIAIQEALRRAKVKDDWIDEVLMGCVLTGGLGQAPARQASIGAGISNAVPCTTINKVCGSGMKTVMMAAQAIKAGDADIIVAGGMESMSTVPYALSKARTGYRMGNGELLDLMIHDGLWDPYNNCHMGNCGDATAEEYSISRQQLDDFSAESLMRTRSAQESGILQEEIVSVSVPQRKGEPLIVSLDEQPSKGDPAKLSQLRPAFSKDGATTAGNASSINDGAAAVILASENAVKRHDLKPIAQIVDYTQFAHAPEWFTTAPAGAIEKVMTKRGLSVAEVDLFEINEAFAVVALVVAQKLQIPRDRLNVNGGAVALGHPIGMTGTRLVLTAAYELRRRNKHRAICSPCIGGGEATAIVLESLPS